MSNDTPPNPDDLRKHIHEKAIEGHLDRIQREFRRGFEILQRYPRSVTIFGSSMARPENPWYQRAVELSGRIVKETGYAVVTGGGPGIMEAASRGATEAGGKAVGLRIDLLREKTANPYATDGMDFTYFFARKTMLTFAAEAFVFFPGGFGTMDELFSILTLIQTCKIPRVPVVMFDSRFWAPFRKFLEDIELKEYHVIDAWDPDIFEITDSIDRCVEIVKKAPVSDWWKNIN